jgi:HPt (histidine-containing phosphotransfer) domain-containing protein
MKVPMGRNAIDLEHLARYTGGEKGLNSEVLRLFDGQITKMVAELHTLLASRDGKRWREVAHSIKGAARGVGAFSMGDLAAFAEPISPADAPAAKDVIAKLEREAETVRAFIEAYLAA